MRSSNRSPNCFATIELFVEIYVSPLISISIKRMASLIAGVDEIATETQRSEGWCYFCIPETEYAAFEVEARALLAESGKISSFHGKKFKQDEATEYEQFLLIIRRYAENTVPTILSCTLNSEAWKSKYISFCERVVTNVFQSVGVTNQTLIDVCKSLTPGLLSFMRLSNHLGGNNELTMEIDSDNIKEQYPSLNTMITGQPVSCDFLLTKFYNAYRTMQFANSPKLKNNGIAVLKDSRSLAVQAADVIGNFSTSYVYYKLGNTSKKRILKGQIFERVFGDKYNTENFKDSIKLCGTNDLELLNDGAFTMEFSSYEE